MSEPLLRVTNLVKRFPIKKGFLFERTVGYVDAVDDVSFEIGRGETLGLVGESGSGKSTLARVVVGLEAASSGSLRFAGEELVGRSASAWRPLRRRVQMVFQDPSASLDPRQSAAAIVAEPLEIHRVGTRRERRARALALLEAVGIPAERGRHHPHEFSGGQRQRVAIARALALEPELVVCDEPTSALDVSIQAQVLNLLHELQQRFGLAYLFIAHDLAVVRALCTRIAVLQRGRIIELAERERLFTRPEHDATRALLAAVPTAVRNA